MPQNIPLSTLFDFAIQQMAAESYIHRTTSEGLSLRDVLEFGNNNLPIGQLNNPDLPGKTRFVDLAGVPNANQITGSAQAFVSRYQIIDHHANDATGFSATLMKDTVTGQYTLSFRSLEYQNHAQKEKIGVKSCNVTLSLLGDTATMQLTRHMGRSRPVHALSHWRQP
jgi:hypothetical protein